MVNQRFGVTGTFKTGAVRMNAMRTKNTMTFNSPVIV